MKITFINPANMFKFLESEYENCFDYVLSDGILLCSILSFSGRYTERISFDFSSIATDIFNIANENKLSLFCVGGCSKEIKLFEEKINSLYPGINLMCASGFEKFEVYAEIITNFKPDICVLSLGAGLQEQYTVELEKLYSDAVFFTSGAFVSQTSKKLYYYPSLVNSLNIRWFYRFVFEKHVRRRLLFIYPKSLFKLLSKNSRERLFNLISNKKKDELIIEIKGFLKL